MRPWFIVAMLWPALALGCSTLVAEPARVQPPRSVPLQIALSNAYYHEHVRVIETVWLDPYAVSAEGGFQDLRQRLDETGPRSEVANRRFDGLTTWGLRWGFNLQDNQASCRLRSATLEIEAVITLPELIDATALTPSESYAWEAYLTRLRLHEDGHVNIYRAGAQELSNEIVALGEMADCEQLRQALTALGDAKIVRIRQADLSFDLETGHGAVFPVQN